MSDRAGILLINPRITSRRNARFPLSVMNLAAVTEPNYQTTLLDGNLDQRLVETTVNLLRRSKHLAAGITVMGGPQVATAIEVSRAIKAAAPEVAVVWGGYFPTLYPDVALNSDYVDFVVRGQGERTLLDLLEQLASRQFDSFDSIPGLSWRRNAAAIHNAERPLHRGNMAPALRYDLLPDPRAYTVKTFLGARTVGHEAALGCRFRCTFCGVAAMFRGATSLPPAERLDAELHFLKESIGADSVQFYDHNFFDREEDVVPLLEVLARHELPWWCYARADALANLSPESWKLIRKSQMRMAYIGAESPNDAMLRSIRKGTKSDQTLIAAELCRRNGVIPELSFMVAPPENTEEDTERTFEFIRKVKQVHPKSEIIVYINTPLPPSAVPNADRLKLPELRDVHGDPVQFPTTPEQWTEQRWIDYACHADAPWLTRKLRRRIRDFVTVLRCRYPTVQDTRSPGWAKATLRAISGWRYATQTYNHPWELTASHRLIGLVDPRVSSI